MEPSQYLPMFVSVVGALIAGLAALLLAITAWTIKDKLLSIEKRQDACDLRARTLEVKVGEHDAKFASQSAQTEAQTESGKQAFGDLKAQISDLKGDIHDVQQKLDTVGNELAAMSAVRARPSKTPASRHARRR